MTKKEFYMLPTDCVVTVFDNQDVAEKVARRLLELGFEDSQISVLYGAEAEEFLDLDGTRHGFFTRLLRKYQQLTGPESFMIAQAEAALEHGRFLLSAKTDGGESERQKAYEAMASHTERTIYFCGQFTMTILKVGQNYGHELEYEKSLA